MNILKIFSKSAKELTKIRSITVIGVLVAAAVVLDGFGSVRIGDYLKINFAFLPLAMTGALFGPAAGAAAGLLTDLAGYLVNPIGGFVPALMLITGLEGFIYGIVLFQLKPEKSYAVFIRIVIARFLVCAVCNLTLNTLALYSFGFISAESFGAAFAARIVTNVITFCLGSYMMMAVIIPVKHFYDLHINLSGQVRKNVSR